MDTVRRICQEGAFSNRPTTESCCLASSIGMPKRSPFQVFWESNKQDMLNKTIPSTTMRAHKCSLSVSCEIPLRAPPSEPPGLRVAPFALWRKPSWVRSYENSVRNFGAYGKIAGVRMALARPILSPALWRCGGTAVVQISTINREGLFQNTEQRAVSLSARLPHPAAPIRSRSSRCYPRSYLAPGSISPARSAADSTLAYAERPRYGGRL